MREYARRHRKETGKTGRKKFWVADIVKKCEQCKKNFKPDSNNQSYCHECRPRHFVVGVIRPPKDPIDKLLDDMDFKRSKMNPYL